MQSRVDRLKAESRVGGEIGVFEKDGLLVVAPVTKQKEFMQEELGDRSTSPQGLWRKNLKHGG